MQPVARQQNQPSFASFSANTFLENQWNDALSPKRKNPG
jgi:hypothetical protein